MSDLNVNTVRDLGSPGDPHPAARAIAELWAAAEFQLLGTEDFAYTARELAVYAGPEADEALILLAATDPAGELAGFIHADLPKHDNTDRLHLELRVRPGLAACPVLEALWPAVVQLARDEGRSRLTWYEPVPPGSGAGTLLPVAGGGAVPRTEVTDVLTEAGFTLTQVEVTGTLDVAGVEPGAATAAPVPPAGYRLESWTGPAPEELLDGLAALHTAMSTDVPAAGRGSEAEKWDADRIRRGERQVARAGRRTVWTAAVDETSGRPVGHSYVEHPAQGGAAAIQMDTVVAADHRGRGLGLTMKQANLWHLREVSPQIRRVHTFNAGENEWMLAINTQLGSRPAWTMGVWELKISGA